MSVRFFSSLRWRVLLFCTLLVGFVVLTLMATLTLFLDQDVARSTDERYQGLLEARSAQVDGLAEKFEAQLKAADFAPTGTDRAFGPEVVQMSWSPANGIRTTAEGKIVDVRDRDYFQAISSGKTDFAVGKAIVSRSTGALVVVFARRALGPDGKTQGLAIMTVGLKALSEMTKNVKVGRDGYAWIVDAAGQVIAHPDSNLLLKPVTDVPGTADLVKHMATEPNGRVIEGVPGQARWITYYRKGLNTAGWTLMLTLPESETLETLNAVHALLLGMLVLGLALAVLLASILARSITKPIHLAATGFRHLAEADADLTRTLNLKRTDEIGALAGDFDTFLLRLRQIVMALQDAQGFLHTMADDLDAASRENRTRVEALTVGIGAAAEGTTSLGDSSVESSSAAEQIARNLQSLDHLISTQAASVNQASAAVEQMAGNIAAVFRSTERLATDFSDLDQAASEAKQTREQSNRLLKVIHDRSTALLEANHAIEDIASRTNLLAMNAAIEAAHAGASGRGFAVVASEIRKLAEGASTQSQQIGRDIQLVQESVQAMVGASDDLNQALERVENRIGGTQLTVREVRDAMAEQQVGADQMLEALGELQRTSAEVMTGSGEMTAGNQTLVEEALRLQSTAQALARQLQTMDGETQGIGAAAEGLAALADRIRGTVGTMADTVGRFKVS
jgi:methyl-accepting chemotaxis protein